MQTAKQQAADIIRDLPDDATLEDIQYHLYVLEKIRQGQKAIEEGRSLRHGEAKARLNKWLET